MNPISRKRFLAHLGIGMGLVNSSSSISDIGIKKTDSNQSRTQKKLRVALCGLGNYAELIAEGLKTSMYCELAGIVTGHPEKAEKWKKLYPIPNSNIYNYENFDKIGANKDIDLVYIVLPNALHKEYTIRAARAGKHVITEKPMAVLEKDCIEMMEECKKAGVQLAVGYRLHFEPYNMEIKRLGQEKVFGQVRFIEAGLGYKTYDKALTGPNNDPNKSWRLVRKLSGGGPLMDLGIYCLQAARYVTGMEPHSVTAQFGPVNDPFRFNETEESITWQMEFPGKTLASCSTSYGFDVNRIFASADDGFFELNPGLGYGPYEGRTSKGGIHFPVIQQQAKQMDEIGKYILEGKPLPSHISGEEGRKDIRIMNAIYESAQTGKKVNLS